MIKIDNLKVSYDKKTIIEDFSLNIKKDAITTIIGPNGCGKSTLLKAISKNLAFESGVVYVDGNNLRKLKTKELAKSMAILPQNPQTPEDCTVKDLVSFGRYPFTSFGKRLSKEDYKIIDWALNKTDMKSYKCRRVKTLSGGERQRAWIAMALAQEPKILLLDEPTTYLDISHQFEVLELIKEIAKKSNMTIVMVLHDINHAARYSDEIVVMKNGVLMNHGRPEKVLNEKTMRDVFSLNGDFFKHNDYPHFIPIESHIGVV